MVTKISNMGNNNFRRSLAAIFVVFALTLSLAGALGISRSTHAQQASPPLPLTPTDNRIELHQALLDLTNPWTVMCIAAHPDDEDGTSLIVMRRKYGAHTVSLFSTFGEGGQNAIGPELYEELGAIRARETMAASEIQGSEPHFLGLKDFGFSKSADEAFRVWGHDEALRRMVLQIRKLRPDVIITNHSVTNNDHGHHQATARLELEAFDAAADPKRFPEQLNNDVSLWQVQRLFVRAGRSQPAAAAGQNPDRQGRPDNIVTIDPNELDPIRGKVYAEEALQALQKHATQGPWPKTVAQMAARFTNSSDGRLPIIRYRLVREAQGVDALPPESHSFVDGLHLSENLAKQLEPPMIESKSLTEFEDDRDRIVSALISAAKDKPYGRPTTVSRSNELNKNSRLSRMNGNLNDALASALGISAKLISTKPFLIPGETAKFELLVSNTRNRGAIAKYYWFGEKGGTTKRGFVMGPELPPNLLPGKTIVVPLTYDTTGDAALTVPRSQHLYDGSTEGKQFTSGIVIDLGETSFPIVADTFLDVVPALEIASVSPSPVVLTPLSFERLGVNTSAVRPTVVNVNLTNHQSSPFSGTLSAASSVADNSADSLAVKLAAGENKTFTMVLSPPSWGSLTFILGNGKVSAPPKQIPVFTALARVTPNLRVGYIRGFDYSLPNALAALGVESKELSIDEVKAADLSKYSSVIVDNRVYESQPGLIAANQKLLDYAKDGGTLIVFYHKSFEWNPDERRNRPQLAPYKLILGDERITDETAPITFSEPEHPLLNVPNKIDQDDFANWIQERGLYYPKDWDSQFHALLQSNDPGEAPLKGGLLVADYGRGHYIYTSMVWYRELRAGVPGAYRMFANMISYGQK